MRLFKMMAVEGFLDFTVALRPSYTSGFTFTMKKQLSCPKISRSHFMLLYPTKI